MKATVCRMVGGVLALVGVFYLLGLREPLPTLWRPTSAQMSYVSPLTNTEAIGVILIAVGLMLLFAPRLARLLRQRARRPA